MSQEASSPALRWLLVSNCLPDLGQLCWLWDGKRCWIGARVSDQDGWLWANTYGSFWWDGKQWQGETETDDDYRPTHWMQLPMLPPCHLDFAENDERTHGAREESQRSEIEELKHRCRDAACCASSFSSEDAATTRRNAERLGVDPDEFMQVAEKAARVEEVTSEEAEACNQFPSQSP